MTSKMIVLTLCVALSALSGLVRGQPYRLGSCASVEPMPDFNMTAFLGDWYIVQKTTSLPPANIRCLINSVAADDENPGQFVLEEVRKSRRTVMGSSLMRVSSRRDGKLKPRRGADTSADLTLQFPLNAVTGATGYKVFITDYDTFAGVYICQKLAFANRQSAMILSRTPNLDKLYVNKVRSRLTRFGVSLYGLNAIDQSGCSGAIERLHRPSGDQARKVKITLDDDPLLSGLFSGAVRKAGERIGDGIEVAKKFYRGITGDSGNQPLSEVRSAEKSESDASKGDAGTSRTVSFKTKSMKNWRRLQRLGKTNADTSKTVLDSVDEIKTVSKSEAKSVEESKLRKEESGAGDADSSETGLDSVDESDVSKSEADSEEESMLRKEESDAGNADSSETGLDSVGEIKTVSKSEADREEESMLRKEESDAGNADSSEIVLDSVDESGVSKSGADSEEESDARDVDSSKTDLDSVDRSKTVSISEENSVEESELRNEESGATNSDSNGDWAEKEGRRKEGGLRRLDTKALETFFYALFDDTDNNKA